MQTINVQASLLVLPSTNTTQVIDVHHGHWSIITSFKVCWWVVTAHPSFCSSTDSKACSCVASLSLTDKSRKVLQKWMLERGLGQQRWKCTKEMKNEFHVNGVAHRAIACETLAVQSEVLMKSITHINKESGCDQKKDERCSGRLDTGRKLHMKGMLREALWHWKKKG